MTDGINGPRMVELILLFNECNRGMRLQPGTVVIPHVEVVQYAFLKVQLLSTFVFEIQAKQGSYYRTILITELPLEIYSEMASLVAAAASAA